MLELNPAIIMLMKYIIKVLLLPKSLSTIRPINNNANRFPKRCVIDACMNPAVIRV
jgi:hypothetical protein